MGKVRVAIVGVGNCANSLIQGLYNYSSTSNANVGLVRPRIGQYAIEDIEVVAAFDVAKTKVGVPLTEAIWAPPNDTFRFEIPCPLAGPKVFRGPTLDGLGKYLSGWIEESKSEPLSQMDVADVLQREHVDVLINYLPVGSQLATEFYMESALIARTAVVNCIPVFIATKWAHRFRSHRVPIIGDDIKSQVGATIVHRVLAQLFRDRGVALDRTMQLNVGGNGDFLNMLERERLASKKKSKTEAIISVGNGLEGENAHIGPSDYVQWLGDRKWAYIRLEGRGFGGAPLNVELKLEVWDSPNSAGIVIDAVRCAKLALDRGLDGPIEAASAYFMKAPPVQMDDNVGLEALENWINDT